MGYRSAKIEYLDILLQHGASVNAKDNRGFTALHRAAEMGKTDLVKNLLEKGADKHIVAEGHTALSLAEGRNHDEIILLLKDNK
ncbi:ankyrin repeat domain-containing protein [Dysgonomonas sp. OttesenSCG-928-M03]|nr:ankyrin repeat domain-containing protein [Dysgonomonas sp. OttesenSCG-928-M03]